MELELELFIGTQECTIDDKRRFSVPPKFRPLLESMTAPSGTLYKLVVVPWYGGCLAAFSLKRWAVIQKRILGLDYTTPDFLSAKRRCMPRMEPMQTDPEGRLMITPEQHAWLRLPKAKSKVIVTGMGQNMEIWNASEFDVVNKTGKNAAARDSDDLTYDEQLETLMRTAMEQERVEAARLQSASGSGDPETR